MSQVLTPEKSSVRLIDSFVAQYAAAFNDFEKQIQFRPETDDQDRRSASISILIHLLFLRFVESADTLTLPELRHQASPRELFESGAFGGESFYHSRLRPAQCALPFDQSDFTSAIDDIPDSAFESLIGPNSLLYQYEFVSNELAATDAASTIDPRALDKTYEHLLARRHRSGAYYTPQAVVDLMCRDSLANLLIQRIELSPQTVTNLLDEKSPDHLTMAQINQMIGQLDALRIVDPACGCGAFLIGMLRQLTSIRRALKQERPTHNASKNLFGVDINPFAVQITKMRLWLAQESQTTPLANFNQTIKTGDSLLGSDPQQNETGKQHGAFDWRHQFPHVFEPNGGFDIVVMNPPYVAAYSRQSEKQQLADQPRLKQLYGGFGGRLNLFTCFVIRALQLLNQNGAAALIVPDTFAAGQTYRKVRQALTRRFSRQRWVLVKPAIFGASVRNAIVFCSNVEKTPPEISTMVIDHQRQLGELMLDLPFYHAAPPSLADESDRIRFFSNRFEHRVWKKMRAFRGSLKDLFITRDGVNPGSRAVRNRMINPSNGFGQAVRPLIEGAQIDPRGYLLHKAEKTILYDADAITAAERKAGTSLRDPIIFDSPKLVSRQTADTLIAAIDLDHCYIALNSVHCTRSILGSTDQLWGLLGLLNSPLARLFYAVDGGETRQVLPQVHIAWLRDFPLPAEGQALLDRIAPITRCVLKQFSDDPLRRRYLGEIHGEVCKAYGIKATDQNKMLNAYCKRYPRFGDDY